MNATIAAVLAACAVVLAGCSAAESSTAATSPAPQSVSTTATTATTPTAPASVEVDVRLAGGEVDPFPRRVDVPAGNAVVLRVESDPPVEIHVHGYDLSAEATPEAPALIAFVADRSGVFEVEAHPDTLLFQLAVR